MGNEQGGVPSLDRAIHEPARLAVMSVLRGVEQVDFNYLLAALGLSRGNLSSHMNKLCEAGYVEVSKQFIGNTPNTSYSITPSGQAALEGYWTSLDVLRPSAHTRARQRLTEIGQTRTLATDYAEQSLTTT